MSWIASGRQQAILFGQEKVQWLKYHPWTKTWGQLLFKLINWSVLPKVQSKVFLVQCSEIIPMCITRCLPAVLNFFSWLKSWISWRTSRYPEWPFSIQAVITHTHKPTRKLSTEFCGNFNRNSDTDFSAGRTSDKF